MEKEKEKHMGFLGLIFNQNLGGVGAYAFDPRAWLMGQRVFFFFHVITLTAFYIMGMGQNKIILWLLPRSLKLEA